MKRIFVFGSNLAGIHGKGAALHARNCWGAVHGVGEGLSGSSYALPTKDECLCTRTLEEVAASIKTFHEFTLSKPSFLFLLTPIGCGLAGFSKEQIQTELNMHNWNPNVVLTMSWIDL